MTSQEAIDYLYGASREAGLKAECHVKCQECKELLTAALVPSGSNTEPEDKDETQEEG